MVCMWHKHDDDVDDGDAVLRNERSVAGRQAVCWQLLQRTFCCWSWARRTAWPSSVRRDSWAMSREFGGTTESAVVWERLLHGQALLSAGLIGRPVVSQHVWLVNTDNFYPRDAVLAPVNATAFPSVCVSHACFVSKRLNISSKLFQHLIAPSF